MKTLMAAAVAASFAMPVQAATLDFDDKTIVDEATNTHKQDGFSFQSSIAYAYGGRMYLHDDSGVTRSLLKRDDHEPFSVHHADIGGYSLLYKAVSGASPDGELEYTLAGDLMHLALVPLYFTVDGFRNGSLISSITSLVPTGDLSNIKFGSLFTDIDELAISLLLPDSRLKYAGDSGWPDDPGEPLLELPFDSGGYYCWEWCGGLQIDKLEYSTLAPVPLPASLTMLLAGLGGLVLTRRTRQCFRRLPSTPQRY